eukprot:scaffold57668_cov63-Phaeocystis_antarctica.AAC.3
MSTSRATRAPACGARPTSSGGSQRLMRISRTAPRAEEIYLLSHPETFTNRPLDSTPNFGRITPPQRWGWQQLYVFGPGRGYGDGEYISARWRSMILLRTAGRKG